MHQSKFCKNSTEYCINFGRKYVCFGEWLQSDANMKVPLHVKDGGWRRNEVGEFAFGSGSTIDKKKPGGRVIGRSKKIVV